MFYLICNSYSPNTAPTNRIMAYIRALSEMRVSTIVVFFYPDVKYSRVDAMYPNIEFRYCWDKLYIDLPRLKLFSIRWYIKQFVKNLLPEDRVYVYAFPDMVEALSNRSDIHVFAETTEHPEASFVNFVNHTSVSQYLKACQRINGIFVISQELKQYFIENGCNPDRVHVINMIVDRTRFVGLEKQSGIAPYIAYCGTASNSKDGVDQLIKAFAIVVEKHPEYNLYIIGSTPSKKQRFDNLELVKKLGIEKNIVFTGVVPAQDIPQLLKNAEILALDRPDNLQAKYGFPTKLGEYLLTANPVVVTSVGDIPLFLEDGISALIAEPDNPDKFAEELCWAIDHPQESKKIGVRGQKIAEQYFNYLTETKKIGQVINN